MIERLFELDYALIAENIPSKEALIRTIADAATGHPHVEKYTADQIEAALAAREQAGSTGFGDGIAIPHCSFPDAHGFIIGIIAIPGGAPFDAVDGNAVDLAFFIIGPDSQRNRHIEILSTISRLLANKRFVKEATAARDAKALRAAFSEYSPKPLGEGMRSSGAPSGDDDGHRSTQTSLIHVFLQREELLPDILETLSTAPYGSFSVVEMKSAGAYMRKLPLFSAFWTDSEDTAVNGHLIIASVDSRLCNDLIRRIRSVPESADDPEGMLVTVQDTTFSFGSLRF